VKPGAMSWRRLAPLQPATVIEGRRRVRLLSWLLTGVDWEPATSAVVVLITRAYAAGRSMSGPACEQSASKTAEAG
jgi:hypothetical protein